MMQLGFHVKGFLNNFLDRDIARTLKPQTRRFFMRAGGAVRKTAQYSLRYAPQVPLSAYTSEERQKWRIAVAQYKAGNSYKPRRRDATSKPGNPPLLHIRGQNPLKRNIFFALNDYADQVVIGPTLRRSGGAQRLEHGGEGIQARPFMAPAFEQIEPRLSSFWT